MAFIRQGKVDDLRLIVGQMAELFPDIREPNEVRCAAYERLHTLQSRNYPVHERKK